MPLSFVMIPGPAGAPPAKRLMRAYTASSCSSGTFSISARVRSRLLMVAPPLAHCHYSSVDLAHVVTSSVYYPNLSAPLQVHSHQPLQAHCHNYLGTLPSNNAPP